MVRSSSRQGIETLLIDTPLARCEVSLLGAQVLSWIPRGHGRELIWCGDAPRKPGRPLRGGIPVCWPWFARQDRPPDAEQHGFARVQTWRVIACAEDDDGEVTLHLTIDPKPAFGWPVPDWPASCHPELHLRIGTRLEVCLRTVNRSDQTLSLTQALHSYFRVGDVRQVNIDGLQGLRYLDKLRDFAECLQTEPWCFEKACDRIYLRSGPEYRILDPLMARVVHITSRGSASTVVWNPGAAGVAELGDVLPADWPGFVCIEAANCAPSDRVTLSPGAVTELVQCIRVSDLEN